MDDTAEIWQSFWQIRPDSTQKAKPLHSPEIKLIEPCHSIDWFRHLPDMLGHRLYIYTKAIEPLKPIEDIVLCLTLQAYPKSLLRKTAELGGNVLGLGSDEPLITVLLLTYWKNSEDDEKNMPVLQTALEKIEQDAAERGQAAPYIYLIYSSRFQDPFGSYGEENKAFMQEVSRTYDPEGMFQKLVPGGFKLFV